MSNAPNPATPANAAIMTAILLRSARGNIENQDGTHINRHDVIETNQEIKQCSCNDYENKNVTKTDVILFCVIILIFVILFFGNKIIECTTRDG